MSLRSFTTTAAVVCTALAAAAPASARPATAPATAVAVVHGHGYTPNSTAVRWLPGASTLNVLLATRTRSADGYAQRAFFFVGSRFIGYDLGSDSAGIRLAWQTRSTVALRYAIYGRSDPLCCPRGSALVRFHWTGSRLQPLDRVPTLRERG